MLEMDERRLDYVSQLRPENGFELCSAVATTYSLDLGALLGVCLSLAGQECLGDPMLANRVSLFASIEKLRDKLVVFCEKGRIKGDTATGGLCVLLEGLIRQVVVKTPKSATASIASFHPKVWILDFVNREEGFHSYRLLVMSRNLTFDGSWDIAARLDGKDVGEPVPESEGIIAFLEYLRSPAQTECDKGLKTRIRKLQKALETVRFEVDSSLYDECEFLPFGPKGTKLYSADKARLFTDYHSNVLIISPFLSSEGPLQRLSEHRKTTGGSSGDFILVSREESLKTLEPALAESFRLCAPKAWLADVDIESLDDGREQGSSIAPAYSDLHAKMYVTEGSDGRNLYLGSMNASRNGMYGNVETLLRLHYKKRRGLFHEIVDGLIGDEKPFGDVDDSQLAFQGNGTDQTELLDRYFHSAAKLLEFLHVNVARTDDAFEMELSFQMDSYEGIEENIALFISPFLDEKQKQPLVGSSLQFSGLRADQVSGFFILSCNGDDGFVRSCVLHCPEERFNSPDLDVDGRVRLVLERILDSDDSALSSYVSFAFGFDTAQGGSGPVRPDPAATGRAATSLAPGMYEQLLRSLSDDPDASKRLEHARSMLDFLPEKYNDDQIAKIRNLIGTFESAVKRRVR